MSLRMLREEFLSNPAQLRQARRARVKALVKRHPGSYLARHAKGIYGV